jgi:hypothetical protein
MRPETQQGTSRRTMPRAGAAVGTTAGVTDTSHCTPEVAEIFRGFYTAKSEHNAAKLMSYFSKTNAYYIDCSSGGSWPSWDALNDFFTPYFASGLPADAISYPLRIVGDACSAMVEFEDAPAFFGHELRILGSVTFDSQHKIIRWMDYWDGRSSLTKNAITAKYPTDFHDGEQHAGPEVIRVAKALAAAFATGDAAAATALTSFDVVHEDMAAHTRVRGQLQVQRYYTRALGQLPYGKGASLVHVEGGSQGGGYEWSAAPIAGPMRRGHTCIELDKTGKISRLTAIYDSSLLSYPAYRSLVGQAAEASL